MAWRNDKRTIRRKEEGRMSKRKTRTYLSVDFDFWVPEPFELDMGHGEADVYNNLLWHMRAASRLAMGKDLREELGLTSNERDPRFLPALLHDQGISIAQIGIADSHAHAYEFFKEKKRRTDDRVRVIHIDAHHDMFTHVEKFGCGNWLGRLVDEGEVDEVRLIYPEWVKDERYCKCSPPDEKYDKVITRTDYGLEKTIRDTFRFNRFKKVFICRSGAWVPPWVDGYFHDMIAGFCALNPNARVSAFGWTKKEDCVREQLDWKQIEKEAEEQKRAMAKLTEVKSD